MSLQDVPRVRASDDGVLTADPYSCPGIGPGRPGTFGGPRICGRCPRRRRKRCRCDKSTRSLFTTISLFSNERSKGLLPSPQTAGTSRSATQLSSRAPVYEGTAACFHKPLGCMLGRRAAVAHGSQVPFLWGTLVSLPGHVVRCDRGLGTAAGYPRSAASYALRSKTKGSRSSWRHLFL